LAAKKKRRGKKEFNSVTKRKRGADDERKLYRPSGGKKHPSLTPYLRKEEGEGG